MSVWRRLMARLCGPERDLAAFFEGLRPVQVGQNGYSRLDRYRDFHTTFSSEAGRRVLHQIIDHCEGKPMTEADVENTHKTAWRQGRREPGLWMLQMMEAVPLDQAPKAESEDPDV